MFIYIIYKTLGYIKKSLHYVNIETTSETRWKCKVNSVSAIHDITTDSKIKSDADSLGTNEFESYEFIISLVIQYDILVDVNTVSKILHNIYINIEASSRILNGFLEFLKLFRGHRNDTSNPTANYIADCINILKKKSKLYIVRR